MQSDLAVVARGWVAAGILAWLTAVIGVPVASASPILTLSDGSTTVIVTDGAGNDSCAAVNCVVYVGTVGAFWIVNVTTGESKNAAAPDLLDLDSVNVHSGFGGTRLTITLTDNGYTPGVDDLKFSIGGTLSSTMAISAGGFGGTSNVSPDFGNPIGTGLAFSAGLSPLAFAGSTSESLANVDPYSLTIRVEINAPVGGPTTASFDAAISTQAAPEPASLALLGLGLAGLGWSRRRK